MTITSYHTQNVKYVYADQVQRRVDIEAYGDIPVIVVNKDTYDDSSLKWLFELENYSNVFLCHHQDFSEIRIANRKKDLRNGFLIYCHMYSENETELIKRIEQEINVNDYRLISDVGDCKVFYIE